MKTEIENRLKKVEKQIQTLDKYVELSLMFIAILGILGVVFMLWVIL